MNTFASYRMLITPLSPIHVGTGESYEPTNYVIEDGVLHEFDTGAVMAALSDADRKALLDIGNRRPDTGMIQALQRYFFERRETLMAHAVQRIPVLPGVANLYASRVGQPANREADGKQVVNRLEIDRTSFNPVTRSPVLFGSSLKGAMRTALLDGVNGGAGLLKVEDRRTGKRRDENNQELQNRLFQYRAGKFELDPMRLVQLADAVWNGEPGLPAAQIHLAVNRKKAPVVDASGDLRKSKADELYQILECVPGWRYRAFSGQVNVQLLDGLGERHQQKIPVAPLRFDAAQIAHACNAYYRPILASEMALMRERGYLDPTWDTTIQRALAACTAKMNRGDVFLLRVGRHSGAESVTLNGVRNIKIMKGRDEKPEYLDAAKTFWLAADEKDQSTKLHPFGWLLVELHPMEKQAADWPELKTACEPHLAAARAFKGKLAEQQTRLEQAKAEAEAKRREEEEKARLAAEEVAQRQARLAALTPNLRRIEEFKADYAARAEQLRGGKDRPNTQCHDMARKLAKDALVESGWTPEEKHAAAEAIAEWLPKVVAVDMKDERKKLKLAALRGEA
jgi:CRISPR-associated protein Csm5